MRHSASMSWLSTWQIVLKQSINICISVISFNDISETEYVEIHAQEKQEPA